jgi:hypothetical protein
MMITVENSDNTQNRREAGPAFSPFVPPQLKLPPPFSKGRYFYNFYAE